MRYIVNEGKGRVRYISGGLFESNGVWIHPRQVLDDYELIICKSGNFKMSVNGQIFEIKEGDGMVLLPGEVHFGVEERTDVSFCGFHLF